MVVPGVDELSVPVARPPGSSRHADLYAQAQKRHWILEIHFVDSIRKIGGFYENRLTVG